MLNRLGRTLFWLALCMLTPKLSAQTIGTVIDWEIDAGSGHSMAVSGAFFKPGGEGVVTAGQDGLIKSWMVESGRERTTWKSNLSAIISVAVSPANALLAAGSSEGFIQLRRLESGEPLQLYSGHKGEVRGLAFSPDGRLLASAGMDGTVRLWGVASGKLIDRLPGPTRAVNAVTFSPDGSQLLAACADGRVYRWSIPSRLPLPALVASDNVLTALAISPNGRYLATGGWDRRVRVWRLKDFVPVALLSHHDNWVTSLAFSPSSRQLVSAGRDRQLAVWNIPSGELERAWLAHQASISSVVFSADGKLLLSASWDGTARLWTGQNSRGLPVGSPGNSFSSTSDRVLAAAISSDQKLVATAYGDGLVQLWAGDNGRPLRAFQASPAAVTHLAFTRTHQLITASADGQLLLWDVPTFERPRPLGNGIGPLFALELTADRTQLMTAGKDRKLRIWNADKGSLLKVLELPPDTRSAAFSPDGSRVALAGLEQLELVATATGLQEKAVPLKGFIPSMVSFSPVGDRLLLAGDGGISLWSLDGRLEQQLRHHTGGVQLARFSPDGSTIVSLGRDFTLRSWNLKTSGPGRLSTLLKTVGDGLLWAPDGKSVLVQSSGLSVFDLQDGRALSTFHRMPRYTVRTAASGMFAGPEASAASIVYRRLDKLKVGVDIHDCYLPQGFDPFNPPPRSPACNSRLYGRSDGEVAVSIPPAPSRVYLLPIGISRFKASSPELPLNLQYAARDTRRLTRVLEKKFGGPLEVVGGKPLVDEDATQEAILSSIEAALEKAEAEPGALVLLFVNTRGMSDGRELLIWPYDYDPQTPVASSIGLSQLSALLSRYSSRVLLLLNAGQPDPKREPTIDRGRLTEALAWSRQGTWVILGGRGEHLVERRGMCRGMGGAFACGVQDGLLGKADVGNREQFSGDGRISIEELGEYLEGRVSRLSVDPRSGGVVQRPALIEYGGGLTVGVVR